MEDTKNENVAQGNDNEKEGLNVAQESETILNDEGAESIENVDNANVTNKKNNVPIIVLAVVCVALLVYLAVTNFGGGSKTYKLSTIYPTYFGEVDGEITLPKGWLYTEQGQLYRNEDGKITLVGQIAGTEMSDEEYESTIDSLSAYYEMNELEENDAKTYYFHSEQDDSVYDIYFFYKDSTFVQVALLDASESEVSSVVNSLKY